ncbi:MAG: putative signal transducing protein [Armatimonadota bacterium]
MGSKPKGSSQTNDEWVVVAEYQVDVEADMAVSELEGSGIRAVRLPVAGMMISAWGYLEPVRVLVPADRADEARELLE